MLNNQVKLMHVNQKNLKWRVLKPLYTVFFFLIFGHKANNTLANFLFKCKMFVFKFFSYQQELEINIKICHLIRLDKQMS